jgi:hypothetical protein
VAAGQRRPVDQLYCVGQLAVGVRLAGRRPAGTGGLKGGRARAEKLTPEEQSEIARKAAAARWQRRSS